MDRIIEIGGVKCRLRTNAALPREYRRNRGRDIFADFQAIWAANKPEATDEERLHALDLCEEITFAMHRFGDPTQPEDLEAWLAQFDEAGAVYTAWPAVLALWINETETTSEPQKKRERPSAK